MTNASDGRAARGARLGLSGVTVAFSGVDVLRDVHLDIDPGEEVAVVGPSGAGKTTLLRLCNATVVPSAGTVRLDGADLAALRGRELRRARARVGFVHQDHALVPNLRVVQNVAAGRLGRRGFWSGLRSVLWTSRADLLGIHALLERVGIEEKLYTRTDKLSGGQQQRVAIARALWQEPSLLLADEPVASVDPARSRDVMRLFVQVAREAGSTLVVSLHDLALAKEFFPRVVGVQDGRIAFDSDPAAVPDATFEALYAIERDEDAAEGRP